MDIEHLKYPVGRFSVPAEISSEELQEAIDYIKLYPSFLGDACEALPEEYLEQPYRPGGWTVRQVVHHIADSHMNAFIRFKLALTEENPIIKPYQEQDWAKLPDSFLPISYSLDLVNNIHFKWAVLLKTMETKDFERCYLHPESQSLVPLKEATLMYAWHSRHHLAHIHLPSLPNSSF